MRNTDAKLFLLPMRRRLMAAAITWLLGIYSSVFYAFHPAAGICICALLLLTVWFQCRRRMSALFAAALMMFTAGNTYSGTLLAVRDLPTPPQTAIEGIVCAIEKENRVQLCRVTLEGMESPSRNILVTLMLDEGEMRGAVRIGQRIRGTGRLFAQDEKRNPGGVGWRVNALCTGYELSGYILPGWTAEGGAVFSLREWFRSVRLSVASALDTLFGSQAPLFQGMMLGEREGVDENVAAAMRLTGTVHILTVSGLHMGLIAELISWILGKTRLGRWPCFFLQTAILLGFSCLVDAGAGTQRALVMATLRALAACRGKAYEPITGLSAAALLMTIRSPLLALTTGFQFSFFVVFGIILIGQNTDSLLRRLLPHHRLLRRVLSSVGIGFVAHMASIPMNLLFYGYIPLLSIPMNLICTSLMPLLMLSGWLTLVLWYLVPGLACQAAVLPACLASAFEKVSMAAAGIEGSILRLPSPYAGSLLLAAALMCLMSRRIRLGRLRLPAACALAVLLAASYAPRFIPSARYVQLDVGQGDAAVIRSGRKAVVVDVGPQYSYDVLRYLRCEGLSVEAVILSHLDEDHTGALGTLLDSEISIPVIVIAGGALDGAEEPPGAGRLALERAMSEGIPVCCVKAGDVLEYETLKASVLSPGDELMGSNERSLLLDMDVSGRRILMTGDLPSWCEPELTLDCDLLKVAHHGSKTATSAAFLETVRPEIALISVGAGNSYGHPSQRVLDDLQAVGAQVMRTDQSGAVTVWLEEEPVRINTYL